MTTKLTEKQKNFAINLINGMNQYQAYIQAGYSNGNKKTAIENACRLASNSNIKAMIEELRAPIYEESISTIRERQAIYTDWTRKKVDDKRLSEESKAKYKFEAMHRLNQIDKVYSDAPTNDNRTYNLVLIGNNEELKEQASRAMLKIMGKDTQSKSSDL